MIIPMFASAAGSLLKTDKTEYTQGEPIQVTAVGDGDDWVGIYLRDDKVEAVQSIRWYYVARNGNTSGSTKDMRKAEETNGSRSAYFDIPAGEYTVYLLEDGGYRILSQVDITVRPRQDQDPGPGNPGKSVTADKSAYTEGEPIQVTAVGEGYDWVGIYLRDDTLKTDQAIRWYYVARDGNKSGDTKDMRSAEKTNSSRSAYFDIPAGEYTVYLLENDGYKVLDSVAITVSENPTVSTAPAAPASVRYDRTATLPGLADGKLTVTAGEDTLPGSSKAYWADSNGPLSDYTAFAPIPCTGKVTEYDMVPHTLIPTAADRILVYAVRGTKQSATPAEVLLPKDCNVYDFGAPAYELQVLSDIHLNASQSHIHNRHFASALADIKKLSPNSIGIFVNGDIADHGETSEYRAFQQLIQDAGAPAVYCAIGNHDLADGPYEQRLKNFLRYTEPGTDTVYYDLWLNGAHFIFLGSEAPGLNAQLSAKQLNWFKEKLAENRDPSRPIYVFLHQGLIDTVAGTFAYQKWHGINQSAQFSKILKDYPEVILFSGHSHWEMDSFQTMKGRDAKLPTIFNTAAGAYLWSDAEVAIEGSQGYYLYVYGDKVLVRGRDFVTGQWIASAQFFVEYEPAADPPSGGDNPPTTSEPAASGAGTADPGQTPATTDSTGNTGNTGSTGSSSSDPSGIAVGLIVGVVAGAAIVAAAAVAVVIGKKRKSGK